MFIRIFEIRNYEQIIINTKELIAEIETETDSRALILI